MVKKGEMLNGKYLSNHTPIRVIRDNIPIPTNESVIGCLYPIKFPITVITENITNNKIQLKIP